MSKKLPAELQSDIRSLRIMALIMAVCGATTVIGIPWAILYLVLAVRLRPSKVFLRFTAFVTLFICWCIAPIFLEIGLLRMIKKMEAYDSKGTKAFVTDRQWSKLGFWRKHGLVTGMISVIVLVLVSITPITYTETKPTDIAYQVQYTQDATLELGESQTRQPGADGQGLERHKVIKPIFARIMGSDFYYDKSALPTQTTQAPVNQVVAQGTKRYQYMWCSSGGYRYYNNEEFKNPKTGFTHKSADFCAQNGQGHMTSLADSAPPQPTTTYTPSYYRSPTYTSCQTYTYINRFSCTTY